MSLQLRPDELLVALENAKSPLFEVLRDKLLALMVRMTDEVVRIIPNVEATTYPSFWDGMACAPISPINPDLPIPEPLQGLDDDGWE